jgi:Predicted nucleotide-binding protein containing TIR-like domain
VLCSARRRERVEGTLREIEIGYGKGTGFSGESAMAEQEEWISFRHALALFGVNYLTGSSTIFKRANAGMIKARAERFIRDGQAVDHEDVPAEFWWVEGLNARVQNWEAGDFETIDRGDTHLQAFGVTFRRSDIERAMPSPPLSLAGHERRQNMTAGKHIFIGHGQSLIWLKLKDFLKDRLFLTVDEFNRVPTAGVATLDRLEEMLKDAAFAFLILTAEDEQADGKVHARLNVVHEAGLFQGRLGFTRAIIMLEDGCEEFSNIQGLGQLRFPAGMIDAKFEEIRRVLEREKIGNAV